MKTTIAVWVDLINTIIEKIVLNYINNTTKSMI